MTTNSQYIVQKLWNYCSILRDDVPKLLTKRAFSCRIERMYEVERFSTSRQNRAGVWLVSELLDSRPVQLEAGWEKPVEGHPDEAGQARVQMSTHARWWGYRWSTRVKFQPGSL